MRRGQHREGGEREREQRVWNFFSFWLWFILFLYLFAKRLWMRLGIAGNRFSAFLVFLSVRKRVGQLRKENRSLCRAHGHGGKQRDAGYMTCHKWITHLAMTALGFIN